MTVFAASYIFKGDRTRLYATGFFYVRLQTIRGSAPPYGALMRPTLSALGYVRQRDRQNRFYLLPNKQLTVMSHTETNCLNAKNSTVPTTSAHETCSQFIAIIRENYPQLKCLRFRIRKKGKCLSLRAKYLRRSIFVHGYDFERTMDRFTRQCVQKVILETYQLNRNNTNN